MSYVCQARWYSVSVWVECVAGTLKTLPCAIDSGTYPYGVKVGEPPPGCEVFTFDHENLFEFAFDEEFVCI